MIFEQIISTENLFSAWQEFRQGKRKKQDVQQFERQVEDNLFHLGWELRQGIYRHGGYQSFHIQDPKPRIIHKASVRDRVMHHAIYRVLYPLFDPTFIYGSYSCRLGKGTHKAVDRLALLAKNVSRGYQRSCFGLKCDIAKFFASIDHQILKNLLRSRRFIDEKTFKLLASVIDSPDRKSGGG